MLSPLTPPAGTYGSNSSRDKYHAHHNSSNSYSRSRRPNSAKGRLSSDQQRRDTTAAAALPSSVTVKIETADSTPYSRAVAAERLLQKHKVSPVLALLFPEA